MSINRANVAYDNAAWIDLRHQHPHKNIRLGRSGYKCLICGRFEQEIIKDHAREHGFINKEAMIAAGAVE